MTSYWDAKITLARGTCTVNSTRESISFFPNYHSMRRTYDMLFDSNLFRCVRLLSRHYPTNLYLHKFGQHASHLCTFCNTCDTIEHLLFDCLLFRQDREIWFTNTGRRILSLSNLTNPQDRNSIRTARKEFKALETFLVSIEHLKSIRANTAPFTSPRTHLPTTSPAFTQHNLPPATFFPLT